MNCDFKDSNNIIYMDVSIINSIRLNVVVHIEKNICVIDLIIPIFRYLLTVS